MCGPCQACAPRRRGVLRVTTVQHGRCSPARCRRLQSSTTLRKCGSAPCDDRAETNLRRVRSARTQDAQETCCFNSVGFDHCTLKQATHAGWLVVSVRVALLWRSMSMANRIFGVIHLVSVRTQVYHPKLWLYSHGLSVRHCAHCKRLLELNLAGSD
jgi:hypothetical protein